MDFLVLLGYFLLFSNVALVTATSSVHSQSNQLLARVEAVLKHAEAISNNLKDTNARLAVLEEEIKRLRQPENQMESCGGFAEMMTKYYKSLDDKLVKIVKRNEGSMHTDIVQEIIAAIRGRNFKEANAKLIEMDNVANIPIIIEQVYNKTASNFGLVVDFAKAVSRIGSSYALLSALYEQMQHNHHNDTKTLIILASTIESQVIAQNSFLDEIKMGAIDLVEGLVITIKSSISSLLKQVMNEGRYADNLELQELAADLAVFSAELSEEVMQALVDDTFGLVDSSIILENIFSLRNTSQAISGISALYAKVHKAGHFSSSLMLNLAYSLAQLRARPEFSNLDDVHMEAFDRMVFTIPTCARNLFFQPLVCLWNEAKSSFITAASAKFNYDKDRRSIFTLNPAENRTATEEELKASMWAVEKVGEKILFRNHQHEKENLYVANIIHDMQSHYVFSWIPGNNTDAQSEWSIELRRKMCYIKSLYTKEYLYASDEINLASDRYAYVFTWKDTAPLEMSNFIWQVREC